MNVQVINSEQAPHSRLEPVAPGIDTPPHESPAQRGPQDRVSPREVTLTLRSRRSMLRNIFAPVATVAAVSAAKSAAAGPNEVPADIDPGSLIPKLVRRITQGATPDDVALASSFGYQGYLEYQLAHELIDDSLLEARLLPYTRLTMNFADLYFANGHYFVMRDMSYVRVLRALYSRRQLFERVVEFWHDHFNTDMNSEFGGYYKVVDDRQVMRPNAMGNFPDLLRSVITSPGMLAYLTNTHNFASHPNENLAREMMELHTLGYGSGYSQFDVQEVARCLTGWTVTPTHLPGGGVVYFNAAEHDDYDKIVLGNLIPGGGGMQDLYTVLDILSDHPATARFIATKLCKWFLQEQPLSSVIDAVAATYTRTRGDIKSMIRTILAPNVLYAAAPKYKRPFHLITSAIRLLDSQIDDNYFILSALENTGHRQYEWSSPDGFPDRAQFWGGNQIARWNFCTSLCENRIMGVRTNASRFFSDLTSPEDVVNRINSDMLQGEMSQNDWNLARDFLALDPLSPTRRAATVGLVMTMQSFHWY
ncbi:MAG: DUF1800 domain-containing protein [Pyrinomonadaceae bacterium]|nr:DUF1800 domain-containing protein [Phycisphaerales bacterium]